MLYAWRQEVSAPEHLHQHANLRAAFSSNVLMKHYGVHPTPQIGGHNTFHALRRKYLRNLRLTPFLNRLCMLHP